jgi:hypothetical protein
LAPVAGSAPAYDGLTVRSPYYLSTLEYSLLTYTYQVQRLGT